jgi:hypothetical protein
MSSSRTVERTDINTPDRWKKWPDDTDARARK